MKKITTFFKKYPTNLGMVINEVHPDNEWVLNNGIPTRKWDGTSCAIIDGEIYKRYDAKIDKKTGKYKRGIPKGAISCQEPDFITGHHPQWIKCDRSNPADKYHFLAFDVFEDRNDGTYELIGENVNGNRESCEGYHLVLHGAFLLTSLDRPFTFDNIRSFLIENDIEGIVFHEEGGDRMCKIRKTDFGIKR